MLRAHGLDVDLLQKALKSARRRGVPAARLVNHAPKVIELLYPAARYPDVSIYQRAMAAENVIVAAIDSLGEEIAHVLSVLFGVDPATSHLLLQQRREIAAGRVGVLPATFERGWWEPQLLADLAAKIYRLHQQGADAYLPQPVEPA